MVNRPRLKSFETEQLLRLNAGLSSPTLRYNKEFKSCRTSYSGAIKSLSYRSIGKQDESTLELHFGCAVSTIYTRSHFVVFCDS